MKRNDKLLIIGVVVIALSAWIAILFLQRTEGNTAVVMHRNTEILRIDLRDGAYEILEPEYMFYPEDYQGDHLDDLFQDCFDSAKTIYCVKGHNGVVIIEYSSGLVGVIHETSPLNICQHQGFNNSPASPITCLPNYIRIEFESTEEDQDDFYSRRVNEWNHWL